MPLLKGVTNQRSYSSILSKLATIKGSPLIMRHYLHPKHNVLPCRSWSFGTAWDGWWHLMAPALLLQALHWTNCLPSSCHVCLGAMSQGTASVASVCECIQPCHVPRFSVAMSGRIPFVVQYPRHSKEAAACAEFKHSQIWVRRGHIHDEKCKMISIIQIRHP